MKKIKFIFNCTDSEDAHGFELISSVGNSFIITSSFTVLNQFISAVILIKEQGLPMVPAMKKV